MTDEMLTAVGCLFVTVTVLTVLVVVSTWLPKFKVVGLTVTGTTPLPVNDTICGLSLAPSLIVNVPARDPVVVGANVTLTVQVPPAASDLPQVFVWA